MKSKLALSGVTALAALLLSACASRYYAWEPGGPPLVARGYAGVAPGRWVRPPRPHAVWIPGHWVRERGGSYWRPGYWR